MKASKVHVAAYDGLADLEVGHLLTELRTGRFTSHPLEIVTIAQSHDPVTTMGGLRVVPDVVVSEVDPAGSALLVLPGSELWDAGGGRAFVELAARFLDARTPVAAICGATAGLARAGLLDRRRHTSAAPEYLLATGYAGGSLYVDERAVFDDGLITAGPQSPVQFARAALAALGLAPEPKLEAYERVFHAGDQAAYAALTG
jgi:putative intracellular protease/amidase